MQFHAASLGEAVPPEDFDAVVQSVFDSSVNLRLAHEDRLITVLLSESYELPQGIRIARKDVPLRSLMVNQRAAVRGEILRFHASPLTVNLRGALVWKCRVPYLDIDMRQRLTQVGCSTAWKLLNEWQRLRTAELIAEDLFQSGAGSLLSQRMSKPVMQLIASAARLDAEASSQAAQGMIGLGPGVTPSGDDILIGFLAGLWSMSRQNPSRLSFVRSFGGSLLQVATQTNEISRTYLYHAARGQFSSSLSNLAAAIARGGDVKETTKIAMRVGHSSGMDSVMGLLVGLSVWNTQYAAQARSRANS